MAGCLKKIGDTNSYCGDRDENGTLSLCKKCFLTSLGKTSPEDPKGVEGDKKTPLQLLPPAFMGAVSWVLKLGAKKYGKWNWRKNKVECQTYVGAIRRHLDAWQEGQDIDPESGQSHLAHIGASVAILLDAEQAGTLVDNRPPKINPIKIGVDAKDGKFIAYKGDVPDQGNEGYGNTEEEAIADFEENAGK